MRFSTLLLAALLSSTAHPCPEFAGVNYGSQHPFARGVRVVATSDPAFEVPRGGKYFTLTPVSAGSGSTGGVFEATPVSPQPTRIVEKAFGIEAAAVGKPEPTTEAFLWAAAQGIGPRVLGWADVKVTKEAFGRTYETTERLLYMERLGDYGDKVIYSGPAAGEGLTRMFSLPEPARTQVSDRFTRLRAIHPDGHTFENIHVTYLKDPPEAPHIIRYRGPGGESLGVDLRGVDWVVSSSYELQTLQKAWKNP